MSKTWLTLTLLLASCAAPARERTPAPVFLASAGPTALRAEEEAQAPEGPIHLTVADAIEVAMERNPDLGMAATRILSAKEAVEEARAGWYPQLSGFVDFSHSNDPVVVFMQKLRQRDVGMGDDFNDPGSNGNVRFGAELDWLLVDFGGRSAAVDLAKIAAGIEEGTREAVLNQLRASVIGTALAIFEAEEFIRVSEESVKLVEQQLDVAQRRFDAGAAQRSDVLTVEVRFAEARERLVRARNGRERGRAALGSLIGFGVDEEFVLDAGGGFVVPPVEAEDLYELARTNRPEVRRAGDAVRAAEREVDFHETGYYPSLHAFGSYAVNQEESRLELGNDMYTVGLRLDVPVFEGFRTKSRVAQAKSRIREARQAERKALLEVEQDVTQARLRLDEARERLKVSEKSEEHAGEALSLIEARYESGAATITEYLDAEVALTGARVRNLAARFDVERSTADLRRALGICSATENGETGGER